jgi:hypothetical protein
MQINDWPINDVRPYPNNPRILKSAADKVAESIKAFGWRQPIVVDAEGVIIIGHSRLAAAKILKLETVPVHVADSLTADQTRALRIADNKTGEFAKWDEGKLADELSALMESVGTVVVTGFSVSEFEALEMQAKSALADLEPLVAPRPPVPSDDDENDDEPDIGNTDGSDEDDDEYTEPADEPDDRTVEDIVNMVPFNVMMPEDSRQALYDAIAKAKGVFGIGSTHEALLLIARNYCND